MSSSSVRAGKAYVEIGARDKTVKGLRSVEKRMKNFGSGMQSIGSSVMRVGAVGGVAIAGITTMFAGFDSEMANVAAKSGATGDQLQQLRDTAKKLGSETQFSAAQAAQGMGFLAQAGYDTEQILAGIPAVLSLAAAGGLELGLAADIASDVAGAYGLAADKIGLVADVIATTASSTNTSVEMMGETFKYVAPLAKAAGQSIQETAAAAGILGNNGIKASGAGTDLKNILVALARTDAQKRLREMGVEAVTAEGEMRPLLDIMRDYGEATKDFTGIKKLNLHTALFGKISAKSASILANSAEAIDTVREKMEGAEGSAAAMATTMQDGVHGSLTSAASAASGLVIELGEGLKPMLMNVIGAGTDFLRWLTEVVKENKILAVALAGGTVAFLAVGSALMIAGTGIVIVGAAIGAVATLISTVGAIVAAVGLPVLLVFAALGLLATGFVAMAAAAVYYSGLGSSVLSALADGWDGLLGTVQDVMTGIQAAVTSGDLAGAAEIMWAGMRVVFWRGVAGLAAPIGEFTFFLERVFKETLRNVVNMHVAAFHSLSRMIFAFATKNYGMITAEAAILGAELSKSLSIDTTFSATARADVAQKELDDLIVGYSAEYKPTGRELTPEQQAIQEFETRPDLADLENDELSVGDAEPLEFADPPTIDVNDAEFAIDDAPAFPEMELQTFAELGAPDPETAEPSAIAAPTAITPPPQLVTLPDPPELGGELLEKLVSGTASNDELLGLIAGHLGTTTVAVSPPATPEETTTPPALTVPEPAMIADIKAALPDPVDDRVAGVDVPLDAAGIRDALADVVADFKTVTPLPTTLPDFGGADALAQISEEIEGIVAAADVDVMPELSSPLPAAAVESAATGEKQVGTTSSAAASLLGFTGDAASDRTAKATEATAEILGRIEQDDAEFEDAATIEVT